MRNTDAFYDTTTGDGAFYRPAADKQASWTSPNESYRYTAVLKFDASRYSSVYQENANVCPKSRKCMWYIRY